MFTLYSVQYCVQQRFYVSQKFPNVEYQHDIPHSGISISFKYFLTKDKDLVVDCNTRVSMHCVWELCCQGPPVWPIKHLGGIQIFSIISLASTDNKRLE